MRTVAFLRSIQMESGRKRRGFVLRIFRWGSRRGLTRGAASLRGVPAAGPAGAKAGGRAERRVAGRRAVGRRAAERRAVERRAVERRVAERRAVERRAVVGLASSWGRSAVKRGPATSGGRWWRGLGTS